MLNLYQFAKEQWQNYTATVNVLS